MRAEGGNQRGGGLSIRQHRPLQVPPGGCLCQALGWRLPFSLCFPGERPSAAGSVPGLDWLGEFCPVVSSVTCSSAVLDQAAVEPRTISCLFISCLLLSVRLSKAGGAFQPDLGSGTALEESGCSQGWFVQATGQVQRLHRGAQ